jgi:hypothetical protein
MGSRHNGAKDCPEDRTMGKADIKSQRERKGGSRYNNRPILQLWFRSTIGWHSARHFLPWMRRGRHSDRHFLPLDSLEEGRLQPATIERQKAEDGEPVSIVVLSIYMFYIFYMLF